MTPYEIKEAEKAMNTLAKLIEDSEAKIKNAEGQMALTARVLYTGGSDWNLFLIQQYAYIIADELKLIAYYKTQVGEQKLRLINAGVNC